MKKLLLVFLLIFSSTLYSQISNFRLQKISRIIDRGTNDVIFDVGGFDFYGQPRLQGRALDIGAAEYQDPTIRVIFPKAGENVTIERGMSVELVGSGGTDFLWNNGETTRKITVSPTNTTTYNLTVTEFETVSTTQIRVTVIDPPSLDAPIANIGNDFTICKNETITLTTNGLPTYTYLWSTGETTQSITVSPNTSQKYSVTVTNGTLSDIDEIIIYVNNCN